MFCIIDYRAPFSVKEKLKKDFIVCEFNASNEVYPAIDGHPDIFMAQIKDKLIVAPNTPKNVFDFLMSYGIKFEFGYEKIGYSYPYSAKYNISCGEKILICNEKVCDKKILELAEILNLKRINVRQGYCRCNAIHLGNDFFIISDKGIEKQLERNNIKYVYINSDDVYLLGVKNGFFPGACGIFEKSLYVIGPKDKIKSKISSVLNELNEKQLNFNILIYEKIIDVGGIFFL